MCIRDSDSIVDRDHATNVAPFEPNLHAANVAQSSSSAICVSDQGVALVPLRISTSFSRRSRYFKVRSALYALAGIGVAIGHWSAAVGATIIGLAVLGLVFMVALRRHLLPDR